MAQKEARLDFSSKPDIEKARKGLAMMKELEQKYLPDMVTQKLANGIEISSNNEKIIQKLTKHNGKTV